jgi:uncharacterized membrane protein YraQ (UPF0718 family)
LTTEVRIPPDPEGAAPTASRSAGRILRRVIWVIAGIIVVFPDQLSYAVRSPAIQNWSTIFVSVTLQAVPFLVLGVLVSSALAALVPASVLPRIFPRKARYAVPAAGLAGALLPGCECSSVPVAGRLIDRGVPPAAGLTFLLAAPAINPVVLVSTAVAFPGRPQMVLARFTGALATAIVVGGLWHWRNGSRPFSSRLSVGDHESHLHDFVSTASADFVQAGGFLVIGAMLVATLQTAVPQSMLDGVAGSGPVAVLTLAALAVLLSICSEADAFVAAGLPQFSLTARLVFLVVGPMVDLKLIALQGGTFGWRFASRFAPLTLVTAVGVSVVVGAVLL